MKPLRVVNFIGSFHQGGSERQAVQLVRLLQREPRVESLIATLNDEGELRGEVVAAGFASIPEFPLTSFYDLNFLRQLRAAVRFLRDNKIDVVQTHDFYTNVFGMLAARLAGVKRRIASKRETGSMRSPAQKIVEKRAFAMAHKIVANSAAVRDYLIDAGISPDKIELVYNGLDLARLTPATTDRDAILHEFGLPTGASSRFVTLVANLRHRVKNQPMFLRAAKIVTAQFPDAHFVLAGEGELRAELEALADELGISPNVHFLGRCTRVPELLSVSSCGVLSSFNEGFSNSILEYMAAGLPVVATDVGGAREAISDGETGFLIGSDDVAMFADRLILLLADEETARAMGRRGAEKVTQKFSLEAQLEATVRLYSEG